jgi:hypothetical protein
MKPVFVNEPNPAEIEFSYHSCGDREYRFDRGMIVIAFVWLNEVGEWKALGTWKVKKWHHQAY